MTLQFDVFELRYSAGTGNRTFGETGTMQPSAFLQRFRRHSSGTCVGSIVLRCHMMTLIDTYPFQESMRWGLRQLLVADPVSSKIRGQ